MLTLVGSGKWLWPHWSILSSHELASGSGFHASLSSGRMLRGGGDGSPMVGGRLRGRSREAATQGRECGCSPAQVGRRAVAIVAVVLGGGGCGWREVAGGAGVSDEGPEGEGHLACSQQGWKASKRMQCEGEGERWRLSDSRGCVPIAGRCTARAGMGGWAARGFS